MNAQSKFVSRDALSEFLAELSARFRVWAPRREGMEGAGAVMYRPFDQAAGVELDKKPTESAKRVLFPPAEALFRFRRETDGGLSLESPPDPGPTLIFGLPPCDARGFLIFDPVYAGSGTAGRAQDTYYLRRRSKTVLIARACSRVLSTCFCHWVGGGPAGSEGADVLALEADDGFVLEAVTPAGAELLEGKALRPAGDKAVKAAEQSRASAQKNMLPAPGISEAPEALRRRFDDAPFWRDEAAHCLSCGACTYLCPTCYCFNMTDEGAGTSGIRLRSWDACMAPLFTLEASGHNPRPDKAARLKNRIGHKFSYYPSLHGQRFACVGCGRCIKSCPSGVDIRRVVTDALGRETASAGAVPGKEKRHA
ncbi:MAG: 4Fe-4S dicluster domain-containing protein [Deltaproteobacteria bacterium]|nr:4Fe-4S dicluster domain-containing protein [Deltaproteobacteria bacterium]